MAALCSALRSKRFNQAKLLINMGIDVNTRDFDRRTALMEICFLEEESKAAKMAKLLLQNGAKVGLRDKKGMTALSYASKFGREQLVSLMIDETHTFDPNSSDNNGNTALHYAATSGNFVVLNLLIKTLKKFKLSVDKVNKRGETPLICASKAGHFLCARILISEGKASKQARDRIGFKNASEWEQTEESIRSASKSPLFMTLQLQMREKSPRGSLDVDENKDQKMRPHTAPVGGKNNKNYRDDLRKLFQYYEGQLSDAFRSGIKPAKPIIVEQTASEDSLSEASEFSEISDLFPSDTDPKSLLSRRFSVARTANNVLNTSNAFRRRSIATAGISTSQNRRLSLLSSSDSRRLSQSSPTPKIRRGSINVIAKLNVTPQLPKQNSTLGKSRRGSFDVRNKAIDLSGKRSAISRSQSPIVNKLMSKLQTLEEASDDETEEDEVLQRSSPAVLQAVTMVE